MPFAALHPLQFKQSLVKARNKEGLYYIRTDHQSVEMTAKQRMLEETREWAEFYFISTGWTWLFSFLSLRP